MANYSWSILDIENGDNYFTFEGGHFEGSPQGQIFVWQDYAPFEVRDALSVADIKEALHGQTKLPENFNYIPLKRKALLFASIKSHMLAGVKLGEFLV